MQDQIEQDLKKAMLSGDRLKAETLKNIKNALQYEAVSLKAKEQGLNDEQIQKVLARESKKRQEAADIYKQAGEAERAKTELAEKAIIDTYLPAQADESQILAAVNDELSKLAKPSPSDMGKIIGAVKQKLGGNTDGATIAKLVKEKLNDKL